MREELEVMLVKVALKPALQLLKKLGSAAAASEPIKAGMVEPVKANTA